MSALLSAPATTARAAPATARSAFAGNARALACAQPRRAPLRCGLRRSGSSTAPRRSVTTMGLFGLGLPELVVIGGVVAVLFGPSKLPELGKTLGKTVKSFQGAAKEFEQELKSAQADSPDDKPKPPPAAMQALQATSFAGVKVSAKPAQRTAAARGNVQTKAATAYAEELMKTAKAVASPGRGILAIDESNATCGKRLDSIGVENTEDNRRAYRELLLTTPGLGQYISGAILFEETLFQNTSSGKSFVQVMNDQKIIPGIKVDKGLVPLANSNGESWCQGLDGLAGRAAQYYKQGARFAKWRSTVNIPAGPTEAAVMDCAYGLARYAAICQDNGLVPIVEPEILLDGEHDIDRTLAVAEKTWAATFKYLADFGVMFEGILLKPSMVTPGADNKKKETPERVAEYTLKMLKRRVPPAVPGIMFLSGGQSELEASLNLNAMNKSPNPWHVSFSYARALQNTVLKTWMGKDGNKKAAQDALLRRAKANSDAQLGKFVPTEEDKKAIESTYQKNYSY